MGVYGKLYKKLHTWTLVSPNTFKNNSIWNIEVNAITLSNSVFFLLPSLLDQFFCQCDQSGCIFFSVWPIRLYFFCLCNRSGCNFSVCATNQVVLFPSFSLHLLLFEKKKDIIILFLHLLCLFALAWATEFTDVKPASAE